MTAGKSPYEGLPARAFWRTGVVGQDPRAIAGLYRKKFPIERTTRIATAGSCFAQHIARNLRRREFSVIDHEPAPPGLSNEDAGKYGFGLFSARYGNIYTARQLLQVCEEALGTFAPADPVWEANGRYFDAMRPSAEPDGLPSPEAVLDQRKYHLERVRWVLKSAEVFVFTLGLTECWIHRESGTAYPTAPGTIVGRYDPATYAFRNFTFEETYDDMRAFMALARQQNPAMRFLLTVSPVPLTATASGEHVLAATVYSKSVLRAVAGQLFHEDDGVDYFPSYEIITSSLSKGAFYEDNLRSIRADGVSAAMDAFFSEHDAGGRVADGEPVTPADETEEDADDDVVCEEILLDAFSR